jgi:hypothetical protein
MYLAEVLRVNAESTPIDYEKKLRCPNWPCSTAA